MRDAAICLVGQYEGLAATPQESAPLQVATSAEVMMHIAFAGSEAAPFSKTGGLGDVLGALPKALVKRGHEVVVFLPAHRESKSLLARAECVPIRVPSPNGVDDATLAIVNGEDGLRWCFVEAPTMFDRAGPY